MTGKLGLGKNMQKIVVHEVDKSSGQRVQKINIYYNFVGKIEGA